MVLSLKRCLPESISDFDRGFCFLDRKKQRNNDVLPGELDRCVVYSGFEDVGSCGQGFLARNPLESGIPKTADPSPMEILDSESGSKPCPWLEDRAEDVMPERVEVVCNDEEGVYFPGLHMVQCGCRSCAIKKNNAKRSVGDWEKHVGSRAKKWKVSIKLKATRQPLGEWVAGYSAGASGGGFNPGLDSRRLSAFFSQKYKPINQKWSAERCAVCRWNEDWEYNKIVICNKCEMAVHQECYGVCDIKDFTDWVCNACKNPSVKRECCLCPVKGGALKPCDVEPFWVHVICAWFRPEMCFLNDKKMEPAVGLMRVPPKTFLQTCQICNQTHGSCLQCCKCSNVYHTSCALLAGFFMELVVIPNKNGRSMIRLKLHCDIHKAPSPNGKLEMQTLKKSRNHDLKSSEPVISVPDSIPDEPERETEPDDEFSAARCRVYIRQTASKRDKRETVINTRLNYETKPENGQSFMSMPERLKHLQKTLKERICLGKSAIHGWGAFARRRIQEGELVAEYVGEVVRRKVSDLREARYKATGRHCYFFTINEEAVIDATMKGTMARLINHSCMPNCYSRIVDLREGEYGRVVIIAKRDVMAGEELTFDYMFDKNQDDKPATPCFCGAPNCRKFM